jgi:integrase
MTRKRKRSSVVEIGTGPARVKIYTVNRKDGYPMFSIYWKEGGQRKVRHLACMEEARLIAQQTTIRLTNGWSASDEVTKRELELLRHCERMAQEFGVSLTAAMDEWASARRTAGAVPLSDAVRFYAANRTDLLAVRTTAQVAAEFIKSLKRKGVSQAYVTGATGSLRRFSDALPGNIGDISVADINRFFDGLQRLSPVSKNGIRRNLVTMFGFAKKQGYLHPDRKTAAELTDSFKVPEKEIAIFTPEEMQRLLLAAHPRILPLIAIGGFAGVRSAEIQRLHWEDIKWDRGHIEIAGSKAKTAARRLVPLTDNLKAWLTPWREETGEIVTINDYSGALSDTAAKAKIPGGWRQNALRHSFISYRVSLTGDVARTSLEAGNSPKMIFRHYREIVDEEAARTWFGMTPPDGWMPTGIKHSLRERMRRLLAQDGTPRVDSDNSEQS